VQIQHLYSIYKEHFIVETDTRKLKPGALFFALKGPSFNGNQFAQQALDLGAAFVIVDEENALLNERCILVNDSLSTLQQLANYHRRQLNIPVLAITGSNGKTTTKELITAVLGRKFRTSATIGNLNNHIGVPLTLLAIRPDAEFAVVEMGANHRYEIEGYCKIAEPTHGLITNCGKAHIEGFGSEEGVRLAKGELYDFLRTAQGLIFRNDDLEYLKEMSRGIEKQITYGTGNVDFQGKAEMDGMFLNVLLNDQGIQQKIKTQLVGAYNFPNIMTAVAVGLTFGVPENDVISALESYQPDNSRSQFLRKGSNEIILDAYNANPTSMRAAIESFARSGHPNKQLWLGAMKEMGTESEAEHEALVALADQFPWAEIVLVGDEFSAVREDHPWFSNSKDAAAFIRSNPPEYASILIKGSRGSKMEVMLEALEMKSEK
jgi:UDP-N-acetylmuramoyl-tripeptide--D-alanyl-D-alanine ligase